jgi:hypothetical protein
MIGCGVEGEEAGRGATRAEEANTGGGGDRVVGGDDQGDGLSAPPSDRRAVAKETKMRFFSSPFVLIR